MRTKNAADLVSQRKVTLKRHGRVSV